MEYYIYNIPVLLIDEPSPSLDIPDFCVKVEECVPPGLLNNVEVVYVGNFKDLKDRNAAYANGGIYITNQEDTSFDMLENFVHEVAHSLEIEHGMDIYSDDLRDEFLAKRKRLYYLLNAAGFHISPLLYSFTEYNQKFDNFLANEVGYPTLQNITMGLFVSPYGATSLQEYFANGFEKYFLQSPQAVSAISPVLYRKIEAIVNPQT